MAAYDLNHMTSNSKYSPEWISLRREIEEWSTTYESPFCKVPSASNYKALKNAIYVPIRLSLGITSIDKIKVSQIPKARQIFYKIRDICEGVDPDDISKY